MELLCPHCLKKVTVADDKAGQVLNCPLCQGVFAAPSLAPPPVRVTPPPPPLPPAVPQMEIPMRPLSASPPPPVMAPPVMPPPPPRPAPPPADYTRRHAFRLRADVLIWLAPVCLFLIVFVFSFFPWHALALEVVNPRPPLSLWELSFSSEHGSSSLFLAYTLFTILTFLVSVACVVVELGLVPLPPQLAQLMPWKSGITFALLLLTFLLVGYDYQQGILATSIGSPIVLGEKIGFRLHVLALLASGLELWVQSRRARNLPLPRFSVKL